MISNDEQDNLQKRFKLISTKLNQRTKQLITTFEDKNNSRFFKTINRLSLLLTEHEFQLCSTTHTNLHRCSSEDFPENQEQYTRTQKEQIQTQLNKFIS